MRNGKRRMHAIPSGREHDPSTNRDRSGHLYASRSHDLRRAMLVSAPDRNGKQIFWTLSDKRGLGEDPYREIRFHVFTVKNAKSKWGTWATGITSPDHKDPERIEWVETDGTSEIYRRVPPGEIPDLIDELSYLFEWLREQMRELSSGEYKVPDIMEVGARMPSRRANPGGRALPTAVAQLKRDGIKLPMPLVVALQQLPRGSVHVRRLSYYGEPFVVLTVYMPEGAIRVRRRGLFGTGKTARGEPGETYETVRKMLREFAREYGMTVTGSDTTLKIAGAAESWRTPY